jgi:hypothetical protein
VIMQRSQVVRHMDLQMAHDMFAPNPEQAVQVQHPHRPSAFRPTVAVISVNHQFTPEDHHTSGAQHATLKRTASDDDDSLKRRLDMSPTKVQRLFSPTSDMPYAPHSPPAAESVFTSTDKQNAVIMYETLLAQYQQAAIPYNTLLSHYAAAQTFLNLYKDHNQALQEQLTAVCHDYLGGYTPSSHMQSPDLLPITATASALHVQHLQADFTPRPGSRPHRWIVDLLHYSGLWVSHNFDVDRDTLLHFYTNDCPTILLGGQNTLHDSLQKIDKFIPHYCTACTWDRHHLWAIAIMANSKGYPNVDFSDDSIWHFMPHVPPLTPVACTRTHDEWILAMLKHHELPIMGTNIYSSHERNAKVLMHFILTKQVLGVGCSDNPLHEYEYSLRLKLFIKEPSEPIQRTHLTAYQMASAALDRGLCSTLTLLSQAQRIIQVAAISKPSDMHNMPSQGPTSASTSQGLHSNNTGTVQSSASPTPLKTASLFPPPLQHAVAPNTSPNVLTSVRSPIPRLLCNPHFPIKKRSHNKHRNYRRKQRLPLMQDQRSIYSLIFARIRTCDHTIPFLTMITITLLLHVALYSLLCK